MESNRANGKLVVNGLIQILETKRKGQRMITYRRTEVEGVKIFYRDGGPSKESSEHHL
jgi:hypothetical protein